MNCTICEKRLTDYLEGKLPSYLSDEMQNHLEHCSQCRALLDALRATDQLIREERGTVPSRDLTNQIMNLIKPKDKTRITDDKFQRILQPILVAASITIAVLGGIRFGNLYNSAKTGKQVPVELALMDDLAMESVNMLTQE